MPSFLQRLNSLKKQSAEKQNEILKHNKTISDARIKIQQLTAELADLNESAEMLEGLFFPIHYAKKELIFQR